MSSLQQKDFLKSISNSRITLSFLFIWNWNDEYTIVVPSYKPYPIPDQIGKIYTRFQTKMSQKPYPIGRHIPV